MKLTQNQFYGLKSDLPSFLKEGSVYLCSDTKEMYIYIEGDIPFKLVEGEKDVITREELDEAIDNIRADDLIIVVSNYAALPDPTTVLSDFYYVNESQGTQWLPGSMGGTYYPKGIYYSNGISWSYVESPYQSSQNEVDLGLNNDKFVTALTLANYSKWDSKYDSSNPLQFETPSQLDDRDTDNRSRTNHTGFQLASTISDFTQASRLSVVDDFITNGITDKSPSQNSVFDGLQKKLNLPTGFITGLQLSINALDNTKFDIAPGIYVVTDFTDLANTAVQIINYAGATGITPNYLGVNTASYIALNSSQTIIQSSSPFLNSDRRTLATIGAVIHSNNVNINVTNEIKAPIVASINQLHDFMKAIGPLNEEGNVYGPNGANLRLNKSVGKIFGLGINPNNYLNPHELSIPSQTELTFAYRLRGGFQYADTQNIDPNNYDLNGVLTAVPSGNKWTIPHLNLFQSGLCRIQYGQTLYNSYNEALAALPTDPFVTEQNIADNAIFRSYLIVKRGTTDLQAEIAAGNALFVPVDKFGNVIGNGAIALTLSNIIAALGYTPENVENKKISLSVIDDIGYPSVKAVTDGLALKQNLIVNPVTGFGAINSIPMFDSNSSITNSSMSQIGLDINISGELTANRVNIDEPSGGLFYIKYGGASDWVLGENSGPDGLRNFSIFNFNTLSTNFQIKRNTGNVLINTTVDDGNKLQVNGNSKFNGSLNEIFISKGSSTDSSGVTVGLESLINNISGISNTALGYRTLKSNLTGSFNVSIGAYSLEGNNNGNFNTAIGQVTLRNNVSGSYNTAIGNNALRTNINGNSNTGVGNNALEYNESGGDNTAFGNSALGSNISGSVNSATGYQSLFYNISGEGNMAYGYRTIYSNTNGNFNSAMGFEALRSNTSGSNNSAYGFQSLWNNTSASLNSAYGYRSLFNNTTGLFNTAIGSSALNDLTTGNNNIAIGNSSGLGITTGGGNTVLGANVSGLSPTLENNIIIANGGGNIKAQHNGTSWSFNSDVAILGAINEINISRGGGGNQFNTAVGRSSLDNNSTGAGNTAIGRSALATNSIGGLNTAIGSEAMLYNSTGGNNTAIGYQALYWNTIGSRNVSVGESALHENTTGENNTAIGWQSLLNNTTGVNNTILGLWGLRDNTTGDGNTTIGSTTLYTNTTGSYNTVIGNATGLGITTGSHNTIIGANIAGLSSSLSSNIIIANGNGEIKAQNTGSFWGLEGNVGIGVNLVNSGYKLDVNGSTRLQGKLTLGSTATLKSYTVATLPVGVEGDIAYVTDAVTPTYLGALTGGGSVKCPVFYNGTAWVSH